MEPISYVFEDEDGNELLPFPLLDPRNRAMIGDAMPVANDEVPPYTGYDETRQCAVSLHIDGEEVARDTFRVEAEKFV